MLLSFPSGSWPHVVLCAFVSATLIVISDGDALGSASWATVGSLALLMSKGGLCPSSVHLVPFGSSLYALGGESLQANVFRSRDSGVSWDKIASNAYSPARDCFATAVTRSRIHVLGGFSCYSSDYYPGHWSTTASTPSSLFNTRASRPVVESNVTAKNSFSSTTSPPPKGT